MQRQGQGMTTLMEIAACLQGSSDQPCLGAVVDCLARVLGVPFALVAGPTTSARSASSRIPVPMSTGFRPLTRSRERRARWCSNRGWRRTTPEADALLSILALCAELELRRIRSERKISRVARQWTATVDTIPDLVAVIAPDYRLLRVNLALARFASCLPKDLVGLKCHQVLHGLEHPWPDCPHEQAMRAGRSVALEIDDPHIGVPLCVTCTPFYDDDGVLVGTVHLARDISEQRHAARVREQLIGELQESLAKVKVLSGFLPICSVCKKIRNDEGSWEQVEVYVRDRTDANFSHGICPGCAKELYPAHFR